MYEESTLQVPTFPGASYGHRQTISSHDLHSNLSSLYALDARNSSQTNLTTEAAHTHLQVPRETLRVPESNAVSHRRTSSSPGPGRSSPPSSSSHSYSTHTRSSAHAGFTVVATRAGSSYSSRFDMQGATLRVPTQNPPSHRRASSSTGPCFTHIFSHCGIAQWHRTNRLIARTELPLLTYDISLHPSSLTTLHPQGSARLLEPAVYPPQRVLSLVIQSLHLPWAWPIDVFATKARYVTVGDVLHAMYRAGRVGVTRAEVDSLDKNTINTGQKLTHHIAQAYEKRCKRIGGLRGYEGERVKGVKRVDFLLGCTKFRGLAPTPTVEEGRWDVFVS